MNSFPSVLCLCTAGLLTCTGCQSSRDSNPQSKIYHLDNRISGVEYSSSRERHPKEDESPADDVVDILGTAAWLASPFFQH